MAHADITNEPNAPEVYFQYEQIDQQQETYIVGMWAFLVTEIMFFGALFLMYGIYRMSYQADWFKYHEQLDWRLGAINTTILLGSSFAAALAVHYSQHRNTKKELQCLWVVVVCALGFLCVKTVEYGTKFEHSLFPNHMFVYGKQHGGGHGEAAPVKGTFEKAADTMVGWIPKPVHAQEGDPQRARLFFSMYFAMTGLHGLHVLIGILCFLVLIRLIKKKSKLITDFVYTEMLCLYWHFVDLVWIFLYPLYYLMPR